MKFFSKKESLKMGYYPTKWVKSSPLKLPKIPNSIVVKEPINILIGNIPILQFNYRLYLKQAIDFL